LKYLLSQTKKEIIAKYNMNIQVCIPILRKKIFNLVVERFSQLILEGSAAGKISTL